FETALIRSTSTLALLLLHVILAIGPLTRINKKYLPLLYNRRHLGVTMFTIALVHGGFGLFQFHALGNVNPIVSLLTSNTRFSSLSGFPFQALGFAALLIFFLMAITSHDFWLHNLSPRVWKTLHMFVYVAYLLIFMHVMLGAIQYETNPVFIWMLVIGAATLIVLHLITGYRETRRDNVKYEWKRGGFVLVCKVNDIEEDRAKMFCIGKERIAVYKTQGKLFAVNNVCKHQNGPLGEGKVLDGCITCPWHGYQYLPQNGQSPPPFKEKVSTYDVRIEEDTVWLNPAPYPEGTERPGAVIII
ncbi:MAG TPA: Rieske 2Fe-2S domain-containing protein, partial [Chitinophagaceae bacterium]|nr:Rieske 2Fe-2S domain-containing protein [Chitinophagaceae bacterium]